MRAALFAVVGALAATPALAQVDPRTPAVLAGIAPETGTGATFAIAFADLNDDHHDEAIVHLAGGKYCGAGGCTTVVMTETEAGWLQVGRMTSGRMPIYRLPGHHDGWYDLGFYVNGGGAPPGVRAVRYDGTKYRSNPVKGMVVGRLPQEATILLGPTSEMMAIAP